MSRNLRFPLPWLTAAVLMLSACIGPGTPQPTAGGPVPQGDGTRVDPSTSEQSRPDRQRLPEPVATPSSRRSPEEKRQGDEGHLRVVDKYGGIYDNPRLTAYVNELGRRLVRVSEQPAERWTFTVLDSPTVNAFALPGGYIYITRGLVALANSEAELAGVIGHEIGHVTAGHASLRGARATIANSAVLGAQIFGAILGLDPALMEIGTAASQVLAGGVLADYSRSDEIEADRLGIRYLARAGYDPYAQADFLESMAASAGLDARMRGRVYNPNTTDFLASHPATGPRTRQAIREAQRAGERIPIGAARNRTRFLREIDGTVYGDSEKQGFVLGRTFSHPVLGLTFTVPDGFRILNSNSAVTAVGPDRARLVLDSGRDDGASLTDYIRRRWVPEIGRTNTVGRLSAVTPRTINGLEAAVGRAPIAVDGTDYDALLVALRLDGALYRLTGLSPVGTSHANAIERAAETFRRLRPDERAGLRERRVVVETVQPGATVAGFAARMADPMFAEERFRVLNDLGPRGQPVAGSAVKIIR
ncbi:MAG: M48 family metalloprotease [Pseudomonadota bacterium]